MPKRTKQSLILAELLGFFLIIIGVLGILTGQRLYTQIAVGMFCAVVLCSAAFAVFAIRAVRK